jgi:protein-L-isoaspartate O-methyltransferase
MNRQEAWNRLAELNKIVAEQGNSSVVQTLVDQLDKAGYCLRAVYNQQGKLVRYRPDIQASINRGAV